MNNLYLSFFFFLINNSTRITYIKKKYTLGYARIGGGIVLVGISGLGSII